ncbi:uncharacterized protein LOC113215517 [Frankliniella occidentalis]|uniref:Uncharacterized protein LOC113215517 n=1 Tax=Frankliniella occidentalis TaxID=133901 RepID=A0A9C6U632_FRAOC|nr:uncharacterized protein LOC113215517 [Frankliniella occidentalis]
MEEIPEKKSTFQGLRVAVPRIEQERKIYQLTVVPAEKTKQKQKTPEELQAIIKRVSKKMQEDKAKDDSKQVKEVKLEAMQNKPKLAVQNLKRKIMSARKGIKIQVIETPKVMVETKQSRGKRVQTQPKPIKIKENVQKTKERACYLTPKSKEFVSESSDSSDEEATRKSAGKDEATKRQEKESKTEGTATLMADLALSDSEEEGEHEKSMELQEDKKMEDCEKTEKTEEEEGEHEKSMELQEDKKMEDSEVN